MISAARTSGLLRTPTLARTYNALVTTTKEARQPLGPISHGESKINEDKARTSLPSVVIKDNICTSKESTTCASGILQDFFSPFAATVVTKLNAAGVEIYGKSNLDEFGMG